MGTPPSFGGIGGGWMGLGLTGIGSPSSLGGRSAGSIGFLVFGSLIAWKNRRNPGRVTRGG